MIDLGYHKAQSNHSVFVNVGIETKWISLLKTNMRKSFAMKDGFGQDENFDGRSSKNIWLSQEAYFEKKLKKI